VKFSTLEIKNFGTIEDITLDLADRGLVLILGENKDAAKADSNGSGKSLLFDALCWCLWGSTVREIKGDEVVRRSANKNCKVTLTFSEGDNTYMVIRRQKDKEHHKPNDLEFFINTTNACGSSMAETQKRVDDAVGVDFFTFRAMMPGAGIRAAEMTDKAIKDLLEGLLQTDLLAKAQAVAKNRVKELELKETLNNQELSIANRDILAQKELRLTYKGKHLSFEDTKREAIKLAETKIQELVTEEAQVLKDIEDSSDKLVKDKESIVESIKRADELSVIFCNQLMTLVDECSAEVDKLENVRLSYKAKSKNNVVAIAALRHAAGECAHCKQVITGEYKEKALQDLLIDEDKNAKMDVMIISKQRDARIRLEEKRKPLKDSESLNLSKKDSLQKMLREVDLAIANAEYMVKTKLTFIRTNLETAKNNLQSIKVQTSPFDSLLASNKEDIKKLKKKIQELEEVATEIALKREKLAFWVDGFSAHGIRSYMLKQVAPILNDRAAVYCKLLTDGEMTIVFQTEKELKNGTVKEDFNILVEQENGAGLYRGISGGEKARADLVISLVLGDLASFRANKQIPFRFMDEAFEKVDDTGLEAVVTLLEAQKENYETIFVVTHKNELKQHFKDTITVTKQKGISTI